MDKRLMLAALKNIDPDGGHDTGICELVCNDVFHDCRPVDVSRMLLPYFEAWPKYSWVWLYPVPHTYMTPREAFANCADDLFNKDTEYGRNRRELLAFLIEQLEREIGQDTAA